MSSKLIGEDTNKDSILAYLHDPEGDDSSLTRKQKELLDWYVDAYTLMRNYNSISDTIQVLKKLGDRRGMPISASTARRYIMDAMYVFGKVNQMKPEIIKHLVIETLMDAKNMAKMQNDPRTMIQAAKELQAVGGLEDAQQLHVDDIERHNIIINIDQKAQRALGMIYKTGVVDFADMLDVEDTDFEEVRNGSQ